MRTAITGAGGAIGARLLLQLVAQGRPCRGLLRHPTPRLARFPQLDLRFTSLRDPAEILPALADVDTVVHAALDHSGDGVSGAISANLETLAALVEACRRQRIRRFIYLSSIVALPPRITPDAIANNTFSAETDWYSQVKVASERWLAANATDLDVVIVRPGLVYGPYMNWTRHAATTVARGPLVLPADHDAPCYAVHVDDVCALTAQLCETPAAAPRLVYAINPETITWAEFYSAHARALGLATFQVRRAGLSEIGARFPPPPSPRGPGPLRRIASWAWHCPALDFIHAARRRAAPPPPPLVLAPSSSPTPADLWPTPFENETYLSTARFTPEHTGGSLGFTCAHPFHSGMQDAIAWLQADLTLT